MNKAFYFWAKKVKISNEQLKESINEIEKGLYEANLGGSVFKKRIAVEGRGKSSGARTIVAFKTNKYAFLFMVTPKMFIQIFRKKKK